MKKLAFGWQRDLPDHRDYRFVPSQVKAATELVKVDLRGAARPVLDQKSLGSCTANAIAAAHQFAQRKCPGGMEFLPSRLFVYYNERAMEGTVGSDAGAQIRDGFKSIAKQGVCPENEWPYVVADFKKKPKAGCYTHALKHQALAYERVDQDLNHMKACLANGFPFVFGFTVFESFTKVKSDGMVPMPSLFEGVIGGHAVLCVGFDARKKRFIVRNSWGPRWGDKGDCYMPFSYLTNPFLSADFWVVRKVEE